MNTRSVEGGGVHTAGLSVNVTGAQLVIVISCGGAPRYVRIKLVEEVATGI